MTGRHAPEDLWARQRRLIRERHAVAVAVDLEKDNLQRIKRRLCWTRRQRIRRELDCEASIQRVITLTNMFQSLDQDGLETSQLTQSEQAA